MERHLIAPLLSQAGAVVVTASDIPIQRQWRDYETRRRCQTFHLRPLDADEVARLLSFSQPKAIDFAYQATAGHPRAVEWLRQLTDGDEGRVLKATAIERRMWLDQIGENTAEYFLRGLTDDLRETAGQASLLRWFNVSLLRETLPGPKSPDDSVYLSQINALNRAGLTVWDIDRGAYRFADPAVRQLVARLYSARLKDNGAHTHWIAHTYYAQETRYVEYLYDALPEALYHRLRWNLVQGHAPEQTLLDCRVWLATEPHPEWQRAASDDWKAVAEALNGVRYRTLEKEARLGSAEQEAEAARWYAAQELSQMMPDVFASLLQFVQKQQAPRSKE
jgi:hypothetical protein